MKKIFRKNQVIITTLAFLIAIAGYISYDRTLGGKEETAPTSATADDADGITYDIAYVDDTETLSTMAQTDGTESDAVETASAADDEEITNPGEAVLTSALAGGGSYASEVKLNREQVRAKNKEALTKVAENETLSEAQRQEAVDQLVTITNISEKEADAEMLLQAKGFTNVVVSLDDDTCDVVLDMGEVTDAKCAQVEDIVKRKTGVDADQIIITPIHTQDAVAESVD